MTSELRPAVEVWNDAVHANLTTPDEPYGASAEAAVAVIEADREAVRAPLLAEIERLTIQLEVESGPSPYCPICGSCGEDGCCGPQRCLYPTTEQAAELAKFKALAETLAGALEPVERLEMWSSSAKDSDMVVTSMATVRKMREAYCQYKEARDEREAKGREKQAADLAKFKALAETLAGALDEWVFRYYWRHEGMNTEQARIYAKAQTEMMLRQYNEVKNAGRSA